MKKEVIERLEKKHGKDNWVIKYLKRNLKNKDKKQCP